MGCSGTEHMRVPGCFIYLLPRDAQIVQAVAHSASHHERSASLRLPKQHREKTSKDVEVMLALFSHQPLRVFFSSNRFSDCMVQLITLCFCLRCNRRLEPVRHQAWFRRGTLDT